MLTVLALVGVLVIGLIVGLVWRGVVVIGNRRALDRLSARIETERQMHAATHATLAAMRRAAREAASGADHSRQW